MPDALSQSRVICSAIEAEFRRYRTLADGAIHQLDFVLLRTSLDPQSNSIAIIMKHLGGNLRSRWTDPLTTDGEKSWRNRDQEFIDDFADLPSLLSTWNRGWDTLFLTLATFNDSDLGRTLTIRGEPHTLSLALQRSVTHAAYHTGQIVQTARILASRHNLPWRTLTVPRGGSQDYNTSLGFDPRHA